MALRGGGQGPDRRHTPLWNADGGHPGLTYAIDGGAPPAPAELIGGLAAGSIAAGAQYISLQDRSENGAPANTHRACLRAEPTWPDPRAHHAHFARSSRRRLGGPRPRIRGDRRLGQVLLRSRPGSATSVAVRPRWKSAEFERCAGAGGSSAAPRGRFAIRRTRPGAGTGRCPCWRGPVLADGQHGVAPHHHRGMARHMGARPEDGTARSPLAPRSCTNRRAGRLPGR